MNRFIVACIAVAGIFSLVPLVGGAQQPPAQRPELAILYTIDGFSDKAPERVALPNFKALANSSAASAANPLAGRIHIGPGIDYLERAFDHSKYGEFSSAPYLDVMIPSLGDPSLAPAGQHVMSIHMQFAPYKLKKGDWEAQRDPLRDTIIKTLAEYAPDLPSKILAAQTITPKDLEDVYALTGGHPFHGELSLDQIFTMRPILGWARYRTPVKNLYLGGSGTHPGNGLTGASGANAAREILRDPR